MKKSELDHDFAKRAHADVQQMVVDTEFCETSSNWMRQSVIHRYSYNYRWMGLPIIQYPADIVAMQELIWKIQPQRIVETGVARGGSLAFYASMLQAIGRQGRVVGVEIELSDENRELILNHSTAESIDIVDGSSTDPEVVAKVDQLVSGFDPVLIVLDSHHGHQHVLDELKLYSKFVQKDSYIVVFDTIIEELPPDSFADRPWGKGNNPKTAVIEFLKQDQRFQIDQSFNDKLLLSVCRDGFLRRVS